MDVQFFNNKIEKFIAGLEKMTILHGFVKKTQKLPKKELEIALKRLNELA